MKQTVESLILIQERSKSVDIRQNKERGGQRTKKLSFQLDCRYLFLDTGRLLSTAMHWSLSSLSAVIATVTIEDRVVGVETRQIQVNK